MVHQIRLYFNKKQKQTRRGKVKGPARQKKSRGGTNPGATSALASLTEDTECYYSALARPFSMGSRGAGIPSFPAVASQKTTGLLNGVCAVGTTGIGFIAVSPSLAYDKPVAYCTTAASTLSDISIVAPFTGLTTPAVSALPYKYNDLVDGTAAAPSLVRGRIVSTALRARYIGTELNKGGRMVAYVSPDHSNLNGQTFEELAGRSEAIRLPVSREWTEVVLFSNKTDEMTYPGHNYGSTAAEEALRSVYPCSNYEYIEGTSPYNGAAPIALMFSGVPGNEFEYEVVVHCEYIGRPTAPQSTTSHCDMNGMSKVQNAASQTGLIRSGTSARTGEKSMAQAFMQFAYENRVAISSAAKMGVNFLNGAPVGRQHLLR